MCVGTDGAIWLFKGTEGALLTGGATGFPIGADIGGGTLVPFGGTFSILKLQKYYSNILTLLW